MKFKCTTHTNEIIEIEAHDCFIRPDGVVVFYNEDEEATAAFNAGHCIKVEILFLEVSK